MWDQLVTPAAKARSRGLRCPLCDSDELRVSQTLHTAEAIVRRRACENGHHFVTKEVLATNEDYNAAYRAKD